MLEKQPLSYGGTVFGFIHLSLRQIRVNRHYKT